MIRREDVADLRPGDVVEYHREDWPEGVVIRGPLHRGRGSWIGLGECPIRFDDGDVNGWAMHEATTLTVVSRAPRLYVNSDRAEPVLGDVVWSEYYGAVFMRTKSQGWIDRYGDEEDLKRKDGLRLLVDGETGQAVTA